MRREAKADENKHIIPNRGIMSDPDEVWSHEQEEAEAGRQHSILSVLSLLPLVALAGLLVVGGLLYFGYELPPYGMNVQPADSTGYRPPPRPAFGVQGTVPRVGVEPALPNLTDGRVPPQAAALRSPLPSTEAVLRRGAVVYANNCAFCHGTSGNGNGPVSESYVPGAPALDTARVRAQAPGVLFYQITNGILSTPNPDTERLLPREWHSFKGTISEGDRWAVVAFTKAIGTAPAPPGPDQTTYPTKPKDIMPGTTEETGGTRARPERAGTVPLGGEQVNMRGENANTGR